MGASFLDRKERYGGCSDLMAPYLYEKEPDLSTGGNGRD